MNTLITKSEFLKRLKAAARTYMLGFDRSPQAVYSNEQRIESAVRVAADSKLPSSPDGLDPITRAVLSMGRNSVTPYCATDTFDAMIVIEEAWEYFMNDEVAYLRFKELNP